MHCRGPPRRKLQRHHRGNTDKLHHHNFTPPPPPSPPPTQTTTRRLWPACILAKCQDPVCPVVSRPHKLSQSIFFYRKCKPWLFFSSLPFFIPQIFLPRLDWFPPPPLSPRRHEETQILVNKLRQYYKLTSAPTVQFVGFFVTLSVAAVFYWIKLRLD